MTLTLLLVAVGGAVGSSLRYLADQLISHRYPKALIATVVINVTGSFLIALVSGWSSHLTAAGFQIASISLLSTGILGGYTTFSTAALEATRLLSSGRPVAALRHTVVMLVLSWGAAVLGLYLTS